MTRPSNPFLTVHPPERVFTVDRSFTRRFKVGAIWTGNITKIILAPVQLLFSFNAFVAAFYMMDQFRQGNHCTDTMAETQIADSTLLKVCAYTAAFTEFMMTLVRQVQKTREYFKRIDLIAAGNESQAPKEFSLFELETIFKGRAAIDEEDSMAVHEGRAIIRPSRSDFGSLSWYKKIIYACLAVMNIICFGGALLVNFWVSYKGLPYFFQNNLKVDVKSYATAIDVVSWLLAIGNTLGWVVVNGDEFARNFWKTLLEHTEALTPEPPRCLKRNLPAWLMTALSPLLIPLTWLFKRLNFTAHSFTSKAAFNESLSKLILKTLIPIFSTVAVAAIFFFKLVSDKYGGCSFMLAFLGGLAMALNNLTTRIPSLEHKSAMWALFKPLLSMYKNNEKLTEAIQKGKLIPENPGHWLLGGSFFSLFYAGVLYNHLTEYGDTANSLFKLIIAMVGINLKSSSAPEPDYSLMIGLFSICFIISLSQFVLNMTFKAGKVLEASIVPSLEYSDSLCKTFRCCCPISSYMRLPQTEREESRRLHYVPSSESDALPLEPIRHATPSTSASASSAKSGAQTPPRIHHYGATGSSTNPTNPSISTAFMGLRPFSEFNEQAFSDDPSDPLLPGNHQGQSFA